MAQWGGQSPPTNVAWVLFQPDVMWVEFVAGSRLAPKVFLQVL